MELNRISVSQVEHTQTTRLSKCKISTVKVSIYVAFLVILLLIRQAWAQEMFRTEVVKAHIQNEFDEENRKRLLGVLERCDRGKTYGLLAAPRLC